MVTFVKKNVFISGGSSGIGLALAKQLASFGANVTILARDKSKLSIAVDQIKEVRENAKQKINSISADIRDYEELSKSLKSYQNPIDILINSAGITYPGRFIELAPKIFTDVIRTNYLGTVFLTKLIVPGMVERRSGAIVNISSLAGLIGIFGYTAYTPSKYALIGFSNCLRSELKSYGINVHLVLPPDTDTPQLAFEREFMPETTKKINSSGGQMSPENVAKVIISGIKRGKFSIIPGFEGKILSMFAPIINYLFFKFAVKQESKINH